jgi:hypothetical protein
MDFPPRPKETEVNFYPGSNPLAFSSGAAGAPVRNLTNESAALGRFAGRSNCRSKDGGARKLARQRADQLRAGDRYDLRALRDSEFGPAPGDNLCGLGSRHKYRLRFHLLSYPKAIKDTGKMEAAYATFRGVGIDD